MTLDNWTEYSVVNPHPVAHPIQNRFVDDFGDALHEFHKVTRIARARVIAASEYLRDYLTAQVAASNFSIQRRLALLTIVLSLVGLFGSLVPENTKTATFDWLSNLLGAQHKTGGAPNLNPWPS